MSKFYRILLTLLLIALLGLLLYLPFYGKHSFFMGMLFIGTLSLLLIIFCLYILFLSIRRQINHQRLALLFWTPIWIIIVIGGFFLMSVVLEIFFNNTTLSNFIINNSPFFNF